MHVAGQEVPRPLDRHIFDEDVSVALIEIAIAAADPVEGRARGVAEKVDLVAAGAWP